VGAFVTPSDVAQLQADVRAEWEALEHAIGACQAAGRIDDQTAVEWGAMRSRVEVYLAQEPSWLHTASQMDAGQQLQRDLAPWHARLNALGCKVGPAPSPPPAPGGLGNILEGVEKALPFIVAILVLREFGRH
jgi:hypothetical protein